MTLMRVFFGDFKGEGLSDLLFYNPGTDHWMLGTMVGVEYAWMPAGSTAGFGHNIDDGRPIWVGHFSQPDKDEVLFYFPGDHNWWLGTHDGTQLKWTGAGNSEGFGNLNDGRPIWIGHFSQPDKDEVLFYFPGDGNWWLGSHDGSQLHWSSPANTGRPWSSCTVRSGRAMVGTVTGEGTGVWGEAHAGNGVVGVTKSGSGAGVLGRNLAGRDSVGVRGEATTGNGVLGVAAAGHGVLGVASDRAGAGIMGRNTGGGDAGLFEGNVTVTGDLILAGADVAEQFACGEEPGRAGAGAVVVLDEAGRVTASRRPYDTRVVGVISGAGDRRPAMILDRGAPTEPHRPVAMTGKAWCLADASEQPIRIGDLLTTSPRPAHAMRVDDRARAVGATIGKALTPLTEGTGLVLLLVGLS